MDIESDDSIIYHGLCLQSFFSIIAYYATAQPLS